jgi:hypothetical protein
MARFERFSIPITAYSLKVVALDLCPRSIVCGETQPPQSDVCCISRQRQFLDARARKAEVRTRTCRGHRKRARPNHVSKHLAEIELHIGLVCTWNSLSERHHAERDVMPSAFETDLYLIPSVGWVPRAERTLEASQRSLRHLPACPEVTTCIPPIFAFIMSCTTRRIRFLEGSNLP